MKVILFVARVSIICVGFSALARPAKLSAQAVSPVTEESYFRYPSLEPVSAISLQLADVPSGLLDAIAPLSKTAAWNCLSASVYKVEVVDKTGNPARKLALASVEAAPMKDAAGHPFTRCDDMSNLAVSHPGGVELILKSQVSSNETILISVLDASTPGKVVWKSDGKLTLKNGRAWSLLLTPQSAPAESLTDGKTRDVGQMSVVLGQSSLFTNSALSVYAKTSDLISTDSKDSKSAFSATLGFQRGLLAQWYSPWHLEESMQGNQTASNLSATTTLGATTLIKWRWPKGNFNKWVLQVPLPPDLTVSAMYIHRFKQLVTAKAPLLPSNDSSINPSMSWSSISLPGTKKLFFWNKDAGKAVGCSSNPYCLGLQVDLGLWYLPQDLTESKSQRVEGYGDVSVLVPLQMLSFASSELPYFTSSDPAKVQIRIKYADSVNSANNYARTKQWTYGVEVIK